MIINQKKGEPIERRGKVMQNGGEGGCQWVSRREAFLLSPSLLVHTLKHNHGGHVGRTMRTRCRRPLMRKNQREYAEEMEEERTRTEVKRQRGDRGGGESDKCAPPVIDAPLCESGDPRREWPSWRYGRPRQRPCRPWQMSRRASWCVREGMRMRGLCDIG